MLLRRVRAGRAGAVRADGLDRPVGPGGRSYGGALGLGGLPELILEVDHPLPQSKVTCGQDPHGKQAGVAGVADRNRRHRDPSRHLDDREQRVHPVQVFQGTGTPITGSGVTGGQHARQVGGTPGSSDEHPQASAVRRGRS